jgi:hypothetical protein
MDADQYRIGGGDIPNGEGQVLVAANPTLVQESPEGAVVGGDGGLRYTVDQLLAPHPERDQILDRDHSEAVTRCELE